MGIFQFISTGSEFILSLLV